MLDARVCLEIYEYCQKEYKKLEQKEGRYDPKHDRIVMERASKRFKMSETIINKAFDLAAQTVLKKNLTKERTERIIRNKLQLESF